MFVSTEMNMETFPYGVLLLYCLAMARADQCIDKLTDDWEDIKEYRLSCGKDNSLIEVNVIAGLGTCKVSECEGSTPYMIENQYNCYWRQQCSIRVPNIDSIDIIVRGGDLCLAKRPDFLSLSSALCVDVSKSAQIIDAVADFKVPDKCKSPYLKAGMIRSHHYYPWDYEGPLVFNGDSSASKCFEVYRLTARDKVLIVTVRDLDLWSTDHLKLVSIGDAGKKEETSLLNKTSVGETLTFGRSTSAVRVMFHVNVYSKGGRGFLLCFANVDFRQKNPDACAEISTSAKVEPIRGESIDPFMLTDPPVNKITTTSSSTKSETCKQCKKRCRKVPKKDKKGRKACRKRCRPLCKKSKGEQKKKGKNKDKTKGKKRQKRTKEAN